MNKGADVLRVSQQCLGSRLSREVGGFGECGLVRETRRHLVTQQQESDRAPPPRSNAEQAQNKVLTMMTVSR